MRIVRKAFDGRWRKFGQPQFVYTVDVRLSEGLESSLRAPLKPVNGRIDALKSGPQDKDMGFLASNKDKEQRLSASSISKGKGGNSNDKRVVVIGAGPAGLFAAIELIRMGQRPVIIERGQPVERRGRDIGALFNRKVRFVY